MNTNNTNLSKLTGYIKGTRRINVTPEEEIKDEQLETTIVEPAKIEEQPEGQTETQDEPKEVVTDQPIAEETPVDDIVLATPEEDAPQGEEPEVVVDETKEEESEEEESEIQVDESELNEYEKEIVDIIRVVGQSNFDKLTEIKGFDKMVNAMEQSFRNYYDKIKDLKESVSKRELEIDEIKTQIKENERNQKLREYELSRYKIDDDDEYILDLKEKLQKQPESQIIKDKLRDEYLRRVAEVEPMFDLHDNRSKLINKRSEGIDNLSSSNKSTAPVFTKEGPSRMPTGYAKRSR